MKKILVVSIALLALLLAAAGSLQAQEIKKEIGSPGEQIIFGQKCDSVEREFSLTGSEIQDGKSFEIGYQSFGNDYQVFVSVNGRPVGYSRSRKDAWFGFHFGVDKSVLRAGKNSATLRSVSAVTSTPADVLVKDLVLVVKGGSLLPSVERRWERILLHGGHTAFSDGSDNLDQRVEKAKNKGYRGFGTCDHNEQINSKNKLAAKYRKVVNPGGIDIGWADYFRASREHTGNDFSVLPGTEITTCWSLNGNKNHSHTLVYGIGEGWPDQQVERLQLQDGKQQELLARLKSLGLFTIAAHPFLTSKVSASITPWEPERLCFDTSDQASQGINGVECFGASSEEQTMKGLDWYFSLMKSHRKVDAVSGCDSHGWSDPHDKDLWWNATWVYTTGLSPSAILTALKEGRTYAARRGIMLCSASPEPSFDKQTVAKASFAYQAIASDLRGFQPKQFTYRVYRDGVLVPSSEKVLSLTRLYQWTDTVVTGEHWYNIVVDDNLVTSPIIVDVR